MERIDKIKSAHITFDGTDSAQRVTISDAGVNLSSRPSIKEIRQPDSTDGLESGYVYIANVVRINPAGGSFDVFVLALDWGGDDCTESPPKERITLIYEVG